MADYIERQTIIDTIHGAIYPYFCGAEDGDELSEDEKLVLSVNKAICTAIKAFPSADVQPVRHGHWIPIGNVDADGNQYYNCSICECGETHVPRIQVYYCWNCGARMDGEQND